MTKTQLQWTRWTLGRGSETACMTWWLMPPISRRYYAANGVKLFRWDTTKMEYDEIGTFATYNEARQYADTH